MARKETQTGVWTNLVSIIYQWMKERTNIKVCIAADDAKLTEFHRFHRQFVKAKEEKDSPKGPG